MGVRIVEIMNFNRISNGRKDALWVTFVSVTSRWEGWILKFDCFQQAEV